MSRAKQLVFVLVLVAFESIQSFYRPFHLIRSFPRTLRPTYKLFNNAKEETLFDDENPNLAALNEEYEGEGFDPFDQSSESTKEFDSMYSLLQKNLKWNETAYLDALIKNDVYKTDNYWETIYPKYKASKNKAIRNGDLKKAKQIEDNFNELMHMGLQRRIIFENSNFDFKDPKIAQENIPGITHAVVNSLLHVAKTPQQLIEEYQQKRAEKRSGWAKHLPPKLLAVYDFLVSLKINPSKTELIKSMAAGVLGSAATFATKGMRYVGAIGVILSIFITFLSFRNAPSLSPQQQMRREPPLNISTFAMATASLICLSIFSLSFAISGIGFYLLPIKNVTVLDKLNLAVIVSIMITAFLSTFFEVYESKSKSGNRWKAAIAGYSEQDIQEFLTKQAQYQRCDIPLEQEYQFEYDAENEERNKKIEEYENPKGKKVIAKTQAELEADKYLVAWQKDMEDRNKPWKEEITAEDLPWLGVKEGFFDNAAKLERFDPDYEEAYLEEVYDKVLWREDDPVSNYKPIIGPWGYREKNPNWFKKAFLESDSDELLGELKREYGVYRKAMFVLDSDVVLKKCDGVKGDEDDDDGGGKKKSPDNEEEEEGGGLGGSSNNNKKEKAVDFNEHEKTMAAYFRGNEAILENIAEEDYVLYEELQAMEEQDAYEEEEGQSNENSGGDDDAEGGEGGGGGGGDDEEEKEEED